MLIVAPRLKDVGVKKPHKFWGFDQQAVIPNKGVCYCGDYHNLKSPSLKPPRWFRFSSMAI